MARYFVLGNGNILTCLDQNAQIRDFYFPYISQENHVNGNKHKLGIWVNSSFSWFDSDSWQKQISYEKETLLTRVKAINKTVDIELLINDCVTHNKNIFLRKIEVKNRSNSQIKEVKFFLHQIFQISGDNFGNTVYYNPLLKSIIFYKGKRYFLINGLICNKESHGISSYTTGIFNDRCFQGTYIDAIDGKLESNPIEIGSVDSTISFDLLMKPEQKNVLFYWICVGEKNTDITQLNKFVLQKTPQKLMNDTKKYWLNWVNKTKFKFENLNENLVNFFKRSLLIIRTHIDKRGAFISSGDSSILHLYKDTYAYMWPRDGALISRSLDRAGYKNLTEKFFKFCCKILTKEGYLFHKYNSDYSLGSSWHPWIHEGHFQLPIQEDQVALILDALWKHYSQYKNDKYIKNIFNCFIQKAGDFILNFIDTKTKLPKESYDLWEEKLGIHTFTCAAVYAGLNAVAKFEKIFGKKEKVKKYLSAAQDIKKNILIYLYDEEKGAFIKGLYLHGDEIKKDKTIDASSSYSIFEFKVLDYSDEKLKSSFENFKTKLFCNAEIGGYARYEEDNYYRVDKNIPGNPWFITALWLAEYYITCAQSLHELKPAIEILEWVEKYSLPTGILPEQINPHSGQALSVAPLSWSHAAYVIAINKYLEKLDSLGICKMSNPPKIKD